MASDDAVAGHRLASRSQRRFRVPELHAVRRIPVVPLRPYDPYPTDGALRYCRDGYLEAVQPSSRQVPAEGTMRLAGKEKQMPKFLDHHPIAHAAMSKEAVEAITGRINVAAPDEFGVTLMNVFVAADGEGYCLSDAPSVDAVINTHGALGYTLDPSDVIEVTSLA
jgi:hypothetical protein